MNHVISAGLYDELRVLDSSTISRPLILRYCDAGRLGLKVAERSLQLYARLVQDHQLLHQVYHFHCELSVQFMLLYNSSRGIRIKSLLVVQFFVCRDG